MPKESNYSKGLVYKICCKDPEIKNVYVGSTCRLGPRKSEHKISCTKESSKHYNFPVYSFIRAHGGWDNWRMVCIKESPCNSRMELVMAEQAMIEELGDVVTLNALRAYQSPEERKEYTKEYDKEYYEQNKEKIAEQKKEYREINKEKIAEKKKEYHLKNKEKIAEQKKEYREQNKEKIAEYREQNKQKYTCPCGKTLTIGNKLRHERTLKHLKYLEGLAEKK